MRFRFTSCWKLFMDTSQHWVSCFMNGRWHVFKSLYRLVQGLFFKVRDFFTSRFIASHDLNLFIRFDGFNISIRQMNTFLRGGGRVTRCPPIAHTLTRKNVWSNETNLDLFNIPERFFDLGILFAMFKQLLSCDDENEIKTLNSFGIWWNRLASIHIIQIDSISLE